MSDEENKLADHEGNETNSEHEEEVDAIQKMSAVRLPPFIRTKPKMWFVQI